jgi:hypothetical protein
MSAAATEPAPLPEIVSFLLRRSEEGTAASAPGQRADLDVLDVGAVLLGPAASEGGEGGLGDGSSYEVGLAHKIAALPRSWTGRRR